jgi:hypothetical protein
LPSPVVGRSRQNASASGKPEIKSIWSETSPMKERGAGYVQPGGKPACSSLPRTDMTLMVQDQ